MDLVIVTHAPDIKLLRHFLASYELYYQNKDNVFIFASRDDQYLLDQIVLPSNTHVLYREQFPEIAGTSPFSHQTFLKLWAHNVVQTPRYIVLDSDFLFVQETSDRDFYFHAKPVWFYQPWVEGEPPLKWRAGSEEFVGEQIGWNYGAVSQWVWDRSIAREFTSTLKIEKILNNDSILELLVYGWFIHTRHADEYEFVLHGNHPKPIVKPVNQKPPTYLELDASASYSTYKDAKYVVFWSHWDLAEQKMVEFFEDSQIANFGRVIRKADDRPLELHAHPDAVAARNYRGIDGAYSDGWVESQIRFALAVPPGTTAIELQLMVPAHPTDPAWRLDATVVSDDCAGASFALGPGTNRLRVKTPELAAESVQRIHVQFGPGFHYAPGQDPREFRARLEGIDLIT